jgi:SAM-dependent methyltransferase
MTEVVYEGRDLEVLGGMSNYYAWIMGVFAPYVTGRVVEYGAGIGNVSELLAPLAKELTLVEPSRALIGQLTQRFAGTSNVRIEEEALEPHVERIADASFDTAILVNVLEHIEDDRKAVSNLFRVLAPGGRLLIFVPAMQWLMSDLDREHGHFRRYHKPDLTAKVAAVGGQILHCRYFDLLGVAPWLLLNKALGSTTFNPTLINIHDKFVVPVSRTIERVISPPFGKNLILVATKP